MVNTRSISRLLSEFFRLRSSGLGRSLICRPACSLCSNKLGGIENRSGAGWPYIDKFFASDLFISDLRHEDITI